MNIVKVLDERIKALAFVDSYGSLSKVIPVTNQKGETVRVPFSDNWNKEDCIRTDRYADMMPNDKFASVFFILKDSQLSHEKFEFGSRKKNLHWFLQSFKLIGWYNCQAFGRESNQLSDEMYLEIIKSVFTEPLTPPNKTNKLTAKYLGMSDEMPREFKPFERKFKKNLELYPFGFITVPFSLRWLACPEDMVVADPLSCANYEGLF